MRGALLALALLSIAVPARARVMAPGGVAVVRVTAIELDECDRGTVRARVELVRRIRGFPPRLDGPLAFRCEHRSLVRSGAVITIGFAPIAVPRGDGTRFEAREVWPTTRGDLPPIDVRSILGRPRSEIERAHALLGTRGGRSRYASGFEVGYDPGDTAISVAAFVPSDLDCADVPAWLGLPPIPGAFPLRRADGCEWPGVSPRHVLAPDLVASLRGGMLEIRRR